MQSGKVSIFYRAYLSQRLIITIKKNNIIKYLKNIKNYLKLNLKKDVKFLL